MTPLATAAAPILQAAQLAAENGPALLAIDGRCGSGKWFHGKRINNPNTHGTGWGSWAAG